MCLRGTSSKITYYLQVHASVVTFATLAETTEPLTFDHLRVNESLRGGSVQLLLGSVCPHLYGF